MEFTLLCVSNRNLHLLIGQGWLRPQTGWSLPSGWVYTQPSGSDQPVLGLSQPRPLTRWWFLKPMWPSRHLNGMCWMNFVLCTTSLFGLGKFLESQVCDCNSFERSPIEHIYLDDLKWVMVAVGSSIPTGGNFLANLFFQNLFVWQIFLVQPLLVRCPSRINAI